MNFKFLLKDIQAKYKPAFQQTGGPGSSLSFIVYL